MEFPSVPEGNLPKHIPSRSVLAHDMKISLVIVDACQRIAAPRRCCCAGFARNHPECIPQRGRHPLGRRPVRNGARISCSAACQRTFRRARDDSSSWLRVPSPAPPGGAIVHRRLFGIIQRTLAVASPLVTSRPLAGFVPPAPAASHESRHLDKRILARCYFGTDGRKPPDPVRGRLSSGGCDGDAPAT